MQEYYFSSEGCFITELSNTSDDPELSIAKARVEQGVTTRWHKLKGTTERYYILSGEGIAEVGESCPQVVMTGDVVIIPPGIKQRVTNTGSVDLAFLAICTPRFLHENYLIDE
ncbi:MAG: cupin domain-containing protein [Gammaproteobacteria bacterium]|nr:cupin domain-containing protein [Gammaproteobacteria bacterium]